MLYEVITWDRRGPYLVPKIRKSKYPEFFRTCLDRGLLISPEYETPSIVPIVADAGEFKSLAKGPSGNRITSYNVCYTKLLRTAGDGDRRWGGRSRRDEADRRRGLKLRRHVRESYNFV